MSSSSDFIAFGGFGETDPDLAELNAAFASAPAVGSTPAISGRPVIRFPEVERAYRTDPEAAIINNMPLHEDPRDLLNSLAPGEFDDMISRQNYQTQQMDKMSKNPYYRFASQLQGLVGPQMGDKIANILTIETEAPVPVIIPDPSPQTAAAAPAPGERVVGQIHENTPTPQQRRVQALRSLDSVIGSAAVSGRTVLTPLTNAKISQALTALRRLHAEKFTGKKLDHFMGSEEAIDMFAQLVAMKFNEGMIKHSSRYQGEVVLPRERADIVAMCADINEQLIFDPSINSFRVGSMEERRRSFRDMFNKRRNMKSDLAAEINKR